MRKATAEILGMAAALGAMDFSGPYSMENMPRISKRSLRQNKGATSTRSCLNCNTSYKTLYKQDDGMFICKDCKEKMMERE